MITKSLFDEIICFCNSSSENDEFISSQKEFTEDEHTIIYLINAINHELHCFRYHEEPYKHLKKSDKVKQASSALEKLTDQTLPTLFNSKLNDFLWITNKKIENAKIAFNGYLSMVFNSNDYESNYTYFNRCIDIYLKTSLPEFAFDFQKALLLLIEQGKNNTTAQSIEIFEVAFDKNLLSHQQLSTPIKLKYHQHDKSKNEYMFLAICDLYEKLLFSINNKPYTNKPCDIVEITNLRNAKANYYISLAKNEKLHIFNRIAHIKSAIAVLKQNPNTQNQRNELFQKLKTLQKESTNSYTTFKQTVDLSDAHNYYDKVFDTLSVEECIYFFIFSLTVHTQEASKTKMLEINSGYISKNLFNEAIQRADGSTKAVLTDWAEALKTGSDKLLMPHIERYCVENFNYEVNFYLSYLFKKISDKSFPIKKVVEDIVNTSYFIPLSRKESFTKGLLSGFNSDFITSIHILMPQVEYAFRELAMSCGDSTSKINENGVEEVLSMDSVLSLPQLNECVDEKWIFNSKTIFTSPYGFGMRNDVAHGMLSDNEFKMTHCFYTWWFVLRLCSEFSTTPKKFFHL